MSELRHMLDDAAVYHEDAVEGCKGSDANRQAPVNFCCADADRFSSGLALFLQHATAPESM